MQGEKEGWKKREEEEESEERRQTEHTMYTSLLFYCRVIC